MPDPTQGRTRFTRALLEFFTIVVGVLVALGVDRGVRERDDRLSEAAYVQRLAEEVRQDTSDFQFRLGLLDEKEASLLAVSHWFATGARDPEDPASLLRHIATGSNFGWNAGPLTRSATYADLLGSGNLGLIRDPAVRMQVIQYYDLAARADRRIDPRRTQYPYIAYRLFPLSPSSDGELLPEEGLMVERQVSTLRTIRTSDLAQHVDAEINRGRFIRRMYHELDDAARELLSGLESYGGETG